MKPTQLHYAISANESAAIRSVMSAAGLAFRFRVLLFILLYLLGFFPPWDFLAGSRGTLWLAASAWVARVGGIRPGSRHHWQ